MVTIRKDTIDILKSKNINVRCKLKIQKMTILKLQKHRISILNSLNLEKSKPTPDKTKIKALEDVEKDISNELIKRFNT